MFNVKKVFKLFIFLFIFFYLPVSGKILSDYEFEDFEHINNYFSNAEENSTYETEEFKILLNNVLDDFFNLLACDLLERDNWVSEYVPEVLSSYYYDFSYFRNPVSITNPQFESRLNKYNFCFATKDKLDEPCNVIVIGDMHGNYLDFSKIVSNLIDNGILTNDLRLTPGNRIVFLGDFVDRGLQGLELSLFLFILKILNPETVTILKGNHESLLMTSQYGFENELIYKIDDLSISVYGRFICLFSFLPEAYCLQICGKNFLFSHGGCKEGFNYKEFIEEEDSMFRMTFNGNSCYTTSPFQWNDISPYVSDIQIIDGRGTVYPVNFVVDSMDGLGIDAIFKGHGHDMPKKVEFLSKYLTPEQLETESSGFCDLSDFCYLSNNRIFLIISTSIDYGEYGVTRYKPSYGFLRVSGDQSYVCYGVDC